MAKPLVALALILLTPYLSVADDTNQDLSTEKVVQIEIIVDTGLSADGGQRLMVNMLDSEGIVRSLIIPASTGKTTYIPKIYEDGYLPDRRYNTPPTHNYRPDRLQEHFQSKMYPGLKRDHVIWFRRAFQIASINLRGKTRVNLLPNRSISVTGKTCLEKGYACSRGSILIHPDDAKFLYDLVYKVGRKNTTLNIGKGLLSKI
ncbi:MAG: hypothetical protein KDD33_04555 [Bdellovibrionales bacterium]|nr:hypothetical protein [Bdellovibrionales bacterium]